MKARSVMLAMLVVAILGVSLALGTGRANSRLLATCTPVADIPYYGPQHTGAGEGHTNCDAGAPSWYFTIRLANRAGDSLTQWSDGPVSGSSYVSTDVVYCTGAIIHSFLYINVGGTGKSDTSAEANGGNPC
jgi:hypothetical protein